MMLWSRWATSGMSFPFHSYRSGKMPLWKSGLSHAGIQQSGHTPILIWNSDRGKRMRSSFRCPLCSTTGEDLMENEETRQGIQEVCESISQICKRFSPQLGGGKKGSQLRIWRILFQLASRRLELMKTIEEELFFKVLCVLKMPTKTLKWDRC